MIRTEGDKKHLDANAEYIAGQNRDTASPSKGLSEEQKISLASIFTVDYEDANRGRKLDSIFSRQGEELTDLNNNILVDSRMLSRIHGIDSRQAQDFLTEMYLQQLEKALERHNPGQDALGADRRLGHPRGELGLAQKWEQKKQFFKDVLRTRVEFQWAAVEKQKLQATEAPKKDYEARILLADHDKLKKLGIEPASLIEKTTPAKDMPIAVTLRKSLNTRLGKAEEIIVSPASGEKVDYRRQIIDLEQSISGLDGQIRDAQQESTGFLGFGKKKKEKKIADLEQQKAGLETQKQQAEDLQKQEKLNERAIKTVGDLVQKVNGYEFSNDNFKTDEVAKAKTLGQFVEALNAELQRLGQKQLTPEQATAQRLVSNSEQRIRQADQRIKELGSIQDQRNYRDMKSDTLSLSY